MVIRHKESEIHSFYADCFYIVSSQPNQREAPVAHKFVGPRSAMNLDSLVRRQELNSLLFSNAPNPQHFRAWLHSPPWSHFLSGVLFWHLWMMHPPRARKHLPLCLHLTNPCAKRKVLILTKRKGKIYKTKSLSNYITLNTYRKYTLTLVRSLEVKIK